MTPPAGRTPWDPANGFRIGALTGGLIGAVLSAMSGVTSLVIIGFAAIGGAVGYWLEKRKQRPPSDGTDQAPPMDR
jgi:hypothetical protein